jgi:acyl-[acyl-carrier-protein]-phospholipid O-acyltransferase/long-chain-fatty-acid--[acyl-carrier-protein] ligase
VELLKKMGTELPNIALPKHFLVIREMPMMGTGKIDFRSVSKIVQDIINDPEFNKQPAKPEMV